MRALTPQFAALVFVAALGMPQPAQASLPMLMEPLTTELMPASEGDPWVAASMRLDPDVVRKLTTGDLDRAHVRLSSELVFEARMKSFAPYRPGRFSGWGHVVDDAGQSLGGFTVQASETRAAVNVWLDDGRRVRLVTGGNAGAPTVMELGGSGSILCDTEGPGLGLAPEAVKGALKGDMGSPDDDYEIDLLVCFTPRARAENEGFFGGDIYDVIQEGIDTANRAYANSGGVPILLRSVINLEVDYDEGDRNLSTNYSRFWRKQGDEDPEGEMDEIHDWRNIYGADLSTLLIRVREADALAGQGQILDGFAPLEHAEKASAFSVMHGEPVGTGTLLAHETGHNMGCAHDWWDIPRETRSLFSYSRGHKYMIGLLAYNTVMATGDGIDSPYYSNPYLERSGVPTGVPIGERYEAYNAQSLVDGGAVTAQFRPHVEWVDPDGGSRFPSGHYHFPWNSLSSALDEAKSGEVIKAKGGGVDRTTTLIDQNVVIDSYDGTFLIAGE